MSDRSKFPAAADAIDVVWVCQQLHDSGVLVPAGLPTMTCERIGTGLIGQNIRISLAWDDPDAAAPRSLVAKLASPDPISRATGVGLRNYEREVRFYRDVAAETDARLAACYAAEYDHAGGDFILLLEDLAPGEAGDQMRGCTVAQAEVVIDVIARLQGGWWQNPRLDEHADWMAVPADAERGEQLAMLWSMAWPAFLARHGDRLSDEQRRMAEHFGGHIGAWVQHRTPPYTLTHGDFRVDNMMFGSGAPGWMVPVDWQTPAIGPGIGDVAYFLGASVVTDDRRAHEERLVRRWHEVIHRADPDYDWATCWGEYRRLAFSGVVMAVAASMLTPQTARGDEMFFTMADRHLATAIDLAADDLLP